MNKHSGRAVSSIEIWSALGGLPSLFSHDPIEKEEGPSGAPFSLAANANGGLEGEFCHQCDGASVAGKDSFRVVEDRVAGCQIVQVTGAVWSGDEGGDVIDSEPLPRIASGNVLRVIEQVGKLSAQAQFEALRKVDLFVGGE